MVSDKHIDSAMNFISSSGSWHNNEFIVFFTIVFLIIISGIGYFLYKASSKQTDKIIDLTKEVSSVIANNTAAIKESTEAIKPMISKSLEEQSETQHIVRRSEEKLNELVRDIREIRENMKYKCISNNYDMKGIRQ